jgi:anti-sigma B factor antagonist
MRIEVRTTRDIHILDFRGSITLDEGASTIRNTVRDMLNKGAKKILLNLGSVECIDEARFAELVISHMTARKQGGHLKFLNSTKRVRDLFIAARIPTVFGVFDSEKAAIDSLEIKGR